MDKATQRRTRRLARAFERSGLSKRELAKRANCSRTYIGMLLDGAVPKYKLVTLERVERALGLQSEDAA